MLGFFFCLITHAKDIQLLPDSLCSVIAASIPKKVAEAMPRLGGDFFRTMRAAGVAGLRTRRVGCQNAWIGWPSGPGLQI